MKAVAITTATLQSLSVLLLTATLALAEEPSKEVAGEISAAKWIWSPAHEKTDVPVGDCYFRKTFSLRAPAEGHLQIVADNQFELFVNGEPAGEGNDWRQMQSIDVSEWLQRGKNCLAIRVTNTDPGPAGLVARLIVKPEGGTYTNLLTDDSWKTTVRRFPGWKQADYVDRDWLAAKAFGSLGATLPWGNEVVIAGQEGRFVVDDGFVIEHLMRDEEVGSLIAMTFDSRGNIIASQEGGPLLRLSDQSDNGAHDTVEVYCKKIKNVQGLLALGTKVFAVGDGPQGLALYSLRDTDRDGVAEQLDALVSFRGSKGEHGAHAVRLGPDGQLYVILGSHTRVARQPAPQSPYHSWYEGDLVQPRQEDPQGHAVGIPAPGGTVIRTDTAGKEVTFVAGGLRNSYDFAFNPDGELFCYDSDMEWDRGAPWYRPTRISHVTPGAELGWRSGWAKWPEYYLDGLPATLSMGDGSPTGVEFYDHTAFPPQYRGALFACDWATGEIHCVQLKRAGATYQATRDPFIEGRPLNATDLAVGPDGAIYFCTGGRGTDGGIYRVRWAEEDSPDETELGEDIDRALRQPQPHADWARRKIAHIKRDMGEKWPTELIAAAGDSQRNLQERLRALDLMVVFGPRPSELLLIDLTNDPLPEIRARAARLIPAGVNQMLGQQLAALLDDQEPLVRRAACESLIQTGIEAPAATLVKLLGDEDLFVAYAARLALEQLPPKQWLHLIDSELSPQAFARLAVAVVSRFPDATAALRVLDGCQQRLQSSDELSQQQRLDILRVTQLALLRGEIAANQTPDWLTGALLELYPAGDHLVNRELVKLLVYLQAPAAAAEFAEQLRSDLPTEEKLHLSGYASRLEVDWDTQSKFALLDFYEEARSMKGGYSVNGYVEQFARDFFAQFTLDERRQIIAAGEKRPLAALSVLAQLPEDLDIDFLVELRKLDGRVRPLCPEADSYRRLRVGILAVLGRDGDEASLEYLRSIYQNEPEQRTLVAVSLSQHPEGENWAYLIDVLKTIEGPISGEVLASLKKVPLRPQQPTAYRSLILLGLKLGEGSAQDVAGLFEHWMGQPLVSSDPTWQSRLKACQHWYGERFPDAPAAELPVDQLQDKWNYAELLNFLETETGKAGDPRAGKLVFDQAECTQCHRFDGRGEVIGPDLTHVARRFHKKEILESIVYPSHIISDQYASQTVTAGGRSYTGMVAKNGEEGITILMSDGRKKSLKDEEVDETEPSSLSAMPAGLLNDLTLKQVADLFAYMSQEPPRNVARRKPSPKR